MPSPNPLLRREHTGGARTAVLSGSMSGVALSFTVDDATGWPTGATGYFYVKADPGNSSEEKILCSLRTGNVITVAASGRGVDGTSAHTHANNATVFPCWTAQEADEANAHAAASIAVHGVAGAVVGTTDTQTLTNKTLSGAANTITAIPKASVTGAPAGDVVGTTDTQTLTNKTISGAANTITSIAQANVTGLLAALAPVGAIVMWAVDTAPSGWLICNGATFSAVTYPALNTLLGGTTLPDLRGKVALGADPVYSPAVRSTGGAATVTLIGANIPAHTHTGPSHQHGILSLEKTQLAGSTSSDNGADSVVQGAVSGRFSSSQNSSSDITAAGGTGTSGTGKAVTAGTPALTDPASAFSTLPPYVALHFIIRAA